MNKTSLFCFGFGQVALSFVEKLLFEKLEINLSTTSRNQTKKKLLKEIEYNSFNFTDGQFDKNLLQYLESAEHILISIPPQDNEDIVLKNFKIFLSSLKTKPKTITYLSATSVYGDHKGNWVDEKSKTNPTSPNGLARLKAELSWLSFCKKSNLPLQIFRLAGIYSNKNNVLERLKKNEIKIVEKSNHYFSRVHVEDIANILFKSLKKFVPGEIYNIADDNPSSYEEVINFGCELLKIQKPEKIKLESISSEALKAFYKDSKKVSNKKIKEFFDYTFKFSSYREGLSYIKNHFI